MKKISANTTDVWSYHWITLDVVSKFELYDEYRQTSIEFFINIVNFSIIM